jgi:hypothetical protein
LAIFFFVSVEMIGFQRLVGLMRFSLHFGCWKLEVGSWKMEDGRWKMEDGRWEMEDGRWEMEKRRRLVAVLDTSACEVARRAEGAGGAPESTWKMVSHEGTKTRRRDVEC